MKLLGMHYPAIMLSIENLRRQWVFRISGFAIFLHKLFVAFIAWLGDIDDSVLNIFTVQDHRYSLLSFFYLRIRRKKKIRLDLNLLFMVDKIEIVLTKIIDRKL